MFLTKLYTVPAHASVSDFDKVLDSFDKMFDNWPKFPVFPAFQEFNKSHLSIVSDMSYVTDDGICTVELVIPGYSKEDVSVSVTEEKLTVTAKGKEKKKHGLSLTGFTRTYALDKRYDVDTVTAAHKDGVLIITLCQKEKTTEKDAKKVEIK